MSVDLDSVFARIGDRVDQAPPPSLERIYTRARSRRRRRITLAGAALLTFAVMAGAATLIPPLASEIAHPKPIDFVGWDQKPQPVIGYGGQPARIGYVASDAKRAYSLWHETSGALRIGAVDLATGGQAWPTLDLGRFGDTFGIIEVTPEAVLAVGEHDDGTSPDYVLFVIAPDSGKLLWHKPFELSANDFEVLPGVIIFPEEGRLSALDITTGNPLWSTGEPADTRAVEPLRPALQTRYAQPSDGTRFVQVTADGDLRVRGAATGRVLSTRSGVPVADNVQYTAIGDELYTVDGKQLSAIPLTGDGPRRTLLTVRETVSIRFVTGCGPGVVCVVESGSGDEGAVAGLDVKSGKEIWRHTAREGRFGNYPTDAGILLTTGAPGPVSANPALTTRWYGLDGALVREFTGRTAKWIDGGNLILEDAPQRLSEPRQDGSILLSMRVYGFSAANDRTVELGEVTTIGLCAVGSKYLVCPGAEGIVAYRLVR